MSELLRMEGISKRFSNTQALDEVNLKINEGEVHILLGENGAGKSTLMKILSGSYHPDSGTIFWHGKRVTLLSPSDSLRLGIAMVYQELTLVNDSSVEENIMLGQFPRKKRSPFVNWNQVSQSAEEVLAKLDLQIDIHRPLHEFDLGMQQLIEIARAISRNAKLIILDEPTSALSSREVGILFKTIRTLTVQGISFIYITHRLQETFEIGERVTILRDGKVAGRCDSLDEINEDDLIKMMVGRKISEQYPKTAHCQDDVLMKITNLSDKRHFHNVGFTLHRGEVIGFAGLVGSGRSEMLKGIFGLSRISSGSIELESMRYQPINSRHALKNGLGLITIERKGNLLLHMPIFINITISKLKELSSFGFRKIKKEKNMGRKYASMLSIVAPNVSVPVASLSGGNQQKVAIARLMASGVKIFLMDDPTRGIDVGAKTEVYKLIDSITEKGCGVILCSSDLQELLGITDKIIVMRRGEAVAEFSTKECSQEMIMAKASGGSSV